jgi:hypothetical protein
MDLGRTYEAVIRINSQSGKGGIAYVLEREHGIELPRRLQIEFSKIVQAIADGEGVELPAERLWQAFEREYLSGNGTCEFIEYRSETDADRSGGQTVEADIRIDGAARTVSGHGNGPVAGFVDAIRKETRLAFDLADYREHALGTGANATAVAYVELRRDDGTTMFGVGIDRNIVAASLKAVVSGVNRLLKTRAKSAKRAEPVWTREIEMRGEPQSVGSHVAHAVRQRHGLDLPPRLEAELSRLIEKTGMGTAPDRICKAFEAEYLDGGKYGFVAHSVEGGRDGGEQTVRASITADGEARTIAGRGNGPLNAFVRAITEDCGRDFELADYREHIIGTGANAGVAAYVELRFAGGESVFGVGIDNSMAVASLKAVVSGVNRMLKGRAG